MNERKKAVVGIFQHWEERDAAGLVTGKGANLVDRFTLDMTPAELLTRKGWKDEARKRAAEAGYKPKAINILAEEKDGCDVAIGVEGAAPANQLGAQRRRPVTRGGQPISETDRSRSMAARKRAFRR